MTERILLESGGTAGIMLESGTGVLLKEVPPCYLAACLADSPVGLWLMGEPSGTNANDETANNNDGTYAGSTFTLGQTGAISGVTAVAFTGTSARMSAPNISAYNLGTTFSVECLVKRARTGVQESLVIRNGNACWWMQFSPSDYVGMAEQGGAGSFRSISTVTDTNWHHLVITNAGATHVVWIDAVDAGLQVDAATAFTDATPGTIEVGNTTGGTFAPFTGSIQAVAIYPTALRPTQVATHYAARSVAC